MVAHAASVERRWRLGAARTSLRCASQAAWSWLGLVGGEGALPPKPESISRFFRRGSERGNEVRAYQVTFRGGLHVDPDELFKSSKVRDTIDKAAKLDFGSRSAARPASGV